VGRDGAGAGAEERWSWLEKRDEEGGGDVGLGGCGVPIMCVTLGLSVGVGERLGVWWRGFEGEGKGDYGWGNGEEFLVWGRRGGLVNVFQQVR